jgi:hypothetical protein
MLTEIKTYAVGDAVMTSRPCINTFEIVHLYGIIISAEAIEMDRKKEWLYTVHTCQGHDDYWDFEIKHVNITSDKYNTNTQLKENNETI